MNGKLIFAWGVGLSSIASPRTLNIRPRVSFPRDRNRAPVSLLCATSKAVCSAHRDSADNIAG